MYCLSVGCGSWTWYYPYLYAPLCTDLKDLASQNIIFEQGELDGGFYRDNELMRYIEAQKQLCCILHDTYLFFIP